MKLIFVDVGGHTGQSVQVALEPIWRFSQVHSFEPDPEFAALIRSKFSAAIEAGRLIVHEAALSDRDGVLNLAGDNAKGGATVVENALIDAGLVRSVKCVDVNRFIEDLGDDVRLYIKLNCEGGEVAILNRLSEARSISKVAAIVADFDVVKTGWGYWEKRRVLKKTSARGLPVVLSEQVMVGKTHAARLSNWFSQHPEIVAKGNTVRSRDQLVKRRVRYFIRDLASAIGINNPGYRRRQ